jgi:hypothetical protein
MGRMTTGQCWAQQRATNDGLHYSPMQIWQRLPTTQWFEVMGCYGQTFPEVPILLLSLLNRGLGPTALAAHESIPRDALVQLFTQLIREWFAHIVLLSWQMGKALVPE